MEKKNNLVGENIKRLRTAKGITQVEMEKRMGIPQGTIAQIESGHRALSDKYRRLLCKFFSVGDEEFYKHHNGKGGDSLDLEFIFSKIARTFEERGSVEKRNALIISLLKALGEK